MTDDYCIKNDFAAQNEVTLRMKSGIGKSQATALMLHNQILNTKGGEKFVVIKGDKIIELNITVKKARGE